MGFVRILEGIDSRKIWSCNYNSNHRWISRNIVTGIRNGNDKGFWFSFWYIFENILGIKIDIQSYR